MKEFSFFVQGRPAPGGSKNAFPIRKGGELLMRNGRPAIAMVDAGGKANKLWKDAVKWQGKSFMRGATPFVCALKVEFVFFLSRPAAHFRTGKFSTILRDDAPQFHIQKPDALKYARSTEDALTSVVWTDDCQTVRICSEKRWCGLGDKEGCAVRIVLLQPQVSTTLL